MTKSGTCFHTRASCLFTFYLLSLLFKSFGFFFRFQEGCIGPFSTIPIPTPLHSYIFFRFYIFFNLGIPLEWYTLYKDYKFKSSQTCLAIRMTCYMAHFTSSLINFCIKAAMVIHRYKKFKKQDVLLVLLDILHSIY